MQFVELINAGHDVIVVDNLCNSSKEAVRRVKKITGKKIPFFEVDIRDSCALNKAIPQIDACIHFAVLKSVGESVSHPLEYYDNNINGTLALIDVLRQHNCKNIIFSSSATVYGNPEFLKIVKRAYVQILTVGQNGWLSRFEQIFILLALPGTLLSFVILTR